MELQPLIDAAEAAAAQGDWKTAAEAAEACLAALPSPASRPGTAVNLLLLQAKAAKTLQQHEQVLKVLDMALQLQPDCAEAMWQRAAAHAAAGEHMARFLDLRRLSELQPTFPGIQEALQQAASACSAQQAAQRVQAAPPPRRTYVRTSRRSSQQTHAAGTAVRVVQLGQHYRTLGLQPGTDMEEVRTVYKQLAMQLHPDKWVLRGAAEKLEAEERFKSVAAAYQAIAEQQQS